MEIKEVIQRVQSLYSKGVQSDDTRLSSRHIYNKLVTVRAQLFQEKINKGQFISPNSYSVIPCIELIKVPVHECPCIPPLGCCTLRSKHPFPAIITSKKGFAIKSVTTLDGRIRYSYSNFETNYWDESNRYTANKPHYYFTNGYLYVTMEKGDEDDAEVIRAELLLTDPIDALTFPSYCEEEAPCLNFKTLEFKIETSMIDTLIQLTAQELIQVFNANQEDSSNNTRDNTEQTTK